MAGTVTWDALRDLAGFRADEGCAVSLYVNLDPRVSPTPAHATTRVHSLLDTARRVEAGRKELTHDQRVALRADLERIRRFVESEFDRDGAHGLAVFSSSLDNLWRPLPLAGSVPDAVKVNDELYLTPLVPLVGQGEGALVAVVGRERGDLYRLQGGRLVEAGHRTEEQPRRHDQGGWSQARYQRHIDELAHAHLRRVAEELDERVRGRRTSEVVVVATEETRSEFSELLSSEARSAVVGWPHADAHASPAELLQVVLPVLERSRAERDAQLLERWREEAGRNGRATAGWAKTLEAASDARIELLLYEQGVERPAWRCPACGRLAAEPGKCPLDGTELERQEEGLDLAVHQTLAHGGTVCAVTGQPDLDPVEGIGALLRY
jgi:peptide chain release factor subunit 1